MYKPAITNVATTLSQHSIAFLVRQVFPHLLYPPHGNLIHQISPYPSGVSTLSIPVGVPHSPHCVHIPGLRTSWVDQLSGHWFPHPTGALADSAGKVFCLLEVCTYKYGVLLLPCV